MLKWFVCKNYTKRRILHHATTKKGIVLQMTFTGDVSLPPLTCSFFSGSYRLASPKSMIFIRFPSRDKHKIFSGFKSKCTILLRWTNSIAWHNCRTKTAHARSLNMNSSSITRSNNSPPSILMDKKAENISKEKTSNKTIQFSTTATEY